MLGDWAGYSVAVPEGLAINSILPDRLVDGERLWLLVGSPLPDGLVGENNSGYW
jgi:hypothetical protein